MRSPDSKGDPHRMPKKAHQDCELDLISETELSDSGVSQSRTMKRRKVGESEQLGSVDAAMDGAILQTNKSQVERTTSCEESQSEDERESEQAGILVPFDVVDPVNDRLCALQHLIPHGLELEKDEILKVAIDYVKALEKEIQMFDKSMEDGPNNDYISSTQPDAHMAADVPKNAGAGSPTEAPETSATSEGSALQKRGLCIVPLSALAKAF